MQKATFQRAVVGKRRRAMVMVGPSSWAALEITSAEPGLPAMKNGSVVPRETEMTEEEEASAAAIHEAVVKASFGIWEDEGWNADLMG